MYLGYFDSPKLTISRNHFEKTTRQREAQDKASTLVVNVSCNQRAVDAIGRICMQTLVTSEGQPSNGSNANCAKMSLGGAPGRNLHEFRAPGDLRQQGFSHQTKKIVQERCLDASGDEPASRAVRAVVVVVEEMVAIVCPLSPSIHPIHTFAAQCRPSISFRPCLKNSWFR